MKRALITGVTGQDGSYLAEAMIADGYVVRGLVRRSLRYSLGCAQHLRNRIEIACGDLTDLGWVEAQVAEFVPDEVYHLAYPRRAPARLVGVSSIERFAATAAPNLLTACERHAPKARLLNVVGYDSLNENAWERATELELRAYSRLAALRLQSYAAFEYHRRHRNLFALSAFVFPHYSPRANPAATPRRIARLAAAAGLGIAMEPKRTIKDGNSEFGFAPDFVDAYRKLLQHESPRDSILKTDGSHRLHEFVDVCFDYVGRRPEDYLRILPAVPPCNIHAENRIPHLAWVSGISETIGLRELARLLVIAEIALLRRELRIGLKRWIRAA